MKRREFLIRAGLTGVAVPTLGRARIPCPPPEASTAAGQSVTTSCSAVDPMSDWLARIGSPGVVWYNGFQAQAEVDLYRFAAATNGNDPTASAPDAHYMQWRSSGGPGNFGYLAITRPAGTHEVDTVWWRPLSPMATPGNGLAVNDPAAGGTIPLQRWAPQGNRGEFASWTKGWYSQNSSINDGIDFWLQLRIKMDPNASAAGMASPCKLFELNECPKTGGIGGTFTNQTLVTWLNGANTAGGPNYNRIYTGDGGGVWSYIDGRYVASDSVDDGDPRITHTYEAQVGGMNFARGTSYCSVANLSPGSSANCWAYSGGWDTLLYHVTPGPVAMTGPHGGTVCALQVYAAHQGETSYTKIRDITFELNGWDSSGQGWQALYFASYCNGLNQPLAFTSSFGQVIFARGNGTNNIPIPCPQV